MTTRVLGVNPLPSQSPLGNRVTGFGFRTPTLLLRGLPRTDPDPIRQSSSCPLSRIRGSVVVTEVGEWGWVPSLLTVVTVEKTPFFVQYGISTRPTSPFIFTFLSFWFAVLPGSDGGFRSEGENFTILI